MHWQIAHAVQWCALAVSGTTMHTDRQSLNQQTAERGCMGRDGCLRTQAEGSCNQVQLTVAVCTATQPQLGNLAPLLTLLSSQKSKASRTRKCISREGSSPSKCSRCLTGTPAADRSASHLRGSDRVFCPTTEAVSSSHTCTCSSQRYD